MGVPITGLLATALPGVVKIVAADGAEYHVIPSWEYAIVFVPCPTATHGLRYTGPRYTII